MSSWTVATWKGWKDSVVRLSVPHDMLFYRAVVWKSLWCFAPVFNMRRFSEICPLLLITATNLYIRWQSLTVSMILQSHTKSYSFLLWYLLINISHCFLFRCHCSSQLSFSNMAEENLISWMGEEHKCCLWWFLWWVSIPFILCAWWTKEKRGAKPFWPIVTHYASQLMK